MSDRPSPFRAPDPDGFEHVETISPPPHRLASGRRARFWVVWAGLALLVGAFVYAVASYDSDSCVGTPIGADPDCDIEQEAP